MWVIVDLRQKLPSGAFRESRRSGPAPKQHLPEHEHWYLAVRQYFLRHASQQARTFSFAAMRPHTNQITAVVVGEIDDRLVRLIMPDDMARASHTKLARLASIRITTNATVSTSPNLICINEEPSAIVRIGGSSKVKYVTRCHLELASPSPRSECSC